MENSNAVLEVSEGTALVPVAVARRLPAIRKPKKLDGKLANRDGISAYSTNKGTRYLAQVRLAGRKPVSKSFDAREEAVQWKREQEADLSGSKGKSKLPSKLTMADLFDRYVEESAKHGAPLPYHQTQMFTRLKAHPMLQSVLVSEMGFSVVRDYCVARRGDGVSPSSLQAEYARISVAIERCADWLGWGDNFIHPLTGARKKLMKARLIADSKKRSRRPSPAEMGMLIEWFNANPGDAGIPMADIVQFAKLNAFRRGEIPALRWADLDVESSTIVCWRKDSSAVGGKREALVPLHPEALEIIMRQPRNERVAEIFPYKGDTIGQRFANGVKALKIEDLHFHDLRHEAITIAAQVLGDVEGMQMSGHKSHRHYKRYVDFQKEDVAKIAGKLAKLRTAVAA